MITNNPNKRFMVNKEMTVMTGITNKPFENQAIRLMANGALTFKPGMCSDGVSPVLRFPIIGYISPPNGRINPATMLPITAPAVFAHDALLEYREEIGITTKECHEAFCLIMNNRSMDWPLKRLYCWAATYLGPRD